MYGLEPVEERQIECETQATIAGILRLALIDVGVVVKGARADQTSLEANQAELDSLLATRTLRKRQPEEVRSAHAKGVPTAPSELVCVCIL